MNRSRLFSLLTLSFTLLATTSCKHKKSNSSSTTATTTATTTTTTAVTTTTLPFQTSSANKWLDSQAFGTTSLVRSFQSTPADPRVPSDVQFFLADFMNTYDAALYGLHNLFNGGSTGVTRARDILTYFNTRSALPARSNQETTIISGELLYVGLLAAQYDQRTGDHQFNAMMVRYDNYVLDSTLNLNGALKGGPNETYASTEQNLDALSYLEMRYHMLLKRNQAGDVDAAKKLRARQQSIATWLINSAYIANQGRFRRGDNDNAYASDTSFQAVQALTNLRQYDPDFYNSSGLGAIDLNKLMRFAENNAMVTNYTYTKPDGSKVNVQGFRYQDQTASPLSFEWTAMALRAYQALGDTAHAAALQKSLQDAMISAPNGTQSWAYAAEPGSTFNDGGGWFATAYPSVASTVWSYMALTNSATSWPYSFGESVPAMPASATSVTGTPQSIPAGTDAPTTVKANSLAPITLKVDPNSLNGSTGFVIGEKAPTDNYVPLYANQTQHNLIVPVTDLTPQTIGDPRLSMHDVK